MNWTAGFVVFVTFFIPAIIIVGYVYFEGKRIDREYDEKIKRIKERYGIKP